MPPKIRELKAMLRKAGFESRSAKGSHKRWYHADFPDIYVTLSGQDGKDAKPYQEDDVAVAIKKAKRRLGDD